MRNGAQDEGEGSGIRTGGAHHFYHSSTKQHSYLRWADFKGKAAVLKVAETGHLVLSTGHAPSAPQAMERIIDLFPPHEHSLAQARLASLLIAVLCQTLVPRADGSGRIAAVEIMLANSAVRNLIREGKLYQLANAIRTSHDIGMMSLDEALVDLYLRKVIDGEILVNYCNDRDEVERLIAKAGVKQTP